MSESSSAHGSRPPIMRLFAKTRPRLVELPGVRPLFADLASRIGGILDEFGFANSSVRVEALDQVVTSAFLSDQSPAFTIAAYIPEWKSYAIVRFEQMLLFRILDAMYGGDPAGPNTAPKRRLTELEQTLTVQLASNILAQLEIVFEHVRPFSVQRPRLVDLAEIDGSVAKSESVVASMLDDTFGHSIDVAIPVAGLDLLRSRLAKPDAEDKPICDPDWADEFRNNVLSASIRLIAKLQGPKLTINDVARLQRGSVLELDSDALRQIKLECEDGPMFVGRLGQVKGGFAIQLESIVIPRTHGE